jgi:hypothetical protein
MQEIEAPSVHAVQQMAVLDKLVRIIIHPRTTNYGLPLFSPFIIHSPLFLSLSSPLTIIIFLFRLTEVVGDIYFATAGGLENANLRKELKPDSTYASILESLQSGAAFGLQLVLRVSPSLIFLSLSCRCRCTALPVSKPPSCS